MRINPANLVGIRPNAAASGRIPVLTLLKTGHMMWRDFR